MKHHSENHINANINRDVALSSQHHIGQFKKLHLESNQSKSSLLLQQSASLSLCISHPHSRVIAQNYVVGYSKESISQPKAAYEKRQQ